MRRRTVLIGAGAGLPSLLAGCIGDNGGRNDDLDPDDDDEENRGTNGQIESGDNGQNTGEIHGADVTVDSMDLGTAVGFRDIPWWYEYDETVTGAVYLFDNDEPPSYFPQMTFLFEPRDEYNEFIEETDFTTARLLLIGSIGPSACYDSIEISDFRIEDGTIVGTAEASTSTNTEDCASDVTFPWTLVRVETEASPPDGARMTIVDGWGDETIVPANERRYLDPDVVEGYVRPSGEPPAIPAPLACEDPEKDRWDGPDEEDVRLGEGPGDDPGLAMRTTQQTYEYGDVLEVRLVNLTDTISTVGVQSWFSLQLQTEAGWEDVRVVEDDRAYVQSLLAVLIAPGEETDWEIELTEQGIQTASHQGNALAVCPEMQDGRYRFIYGTADPLGVEFDVVQPE